MEGPLLEMAEKVKKFGDPEELSKKVAELEAELSRARKDVDFSLKLRSRFARDKNLNKRRWKNSETLHRHLNNMSKKERNEWYRDIAKRERKKTPRDREDTPLRDIVV